MRTSKFSLLIASLALILVQCGGGKPTPDAFRSMTKNKMVRIATDPNNVPFEWGLGTSVQGFDVDLGVEIAKELGYPTKWIPISFDRLFEVLRNGEVEMVISSVSITDDRKKEFAFSDPYFESSNTIARRRDNNEIKDLASLAGKRVGVQAGRTGDTFMTTQMTAPNVTISRFPTLDDALGALNRGEVDAVIGDKPIITYSIAKSAYKTNLITTDVELTHSQYAVVVRPEETKLLAVINETIARLKNSKQLDAWKEKWGLGQVLTEMRNEVKDIEQKEKLRASPKTLNVIFIKEPGSAVKQLDLLDGFTATLSGALGTFTSTAIRTDIDGIKGDCRFVTPVPPGEYKLIISRIKVNQAITVEKREARSLTLTLRFTAKGLDISWE